MNAQPGVMEFPGVEISNGALLTWVDEIKNLCTPKDIYWCNGSKEEYDRLCKQLVSKGTFIKLNEEKWPNSYACFF